MRDASGKLTANGVDLLIGGHLRVGDAGGGDIADGELDLTDSTAEVTDMTVGVGRVGGGVVRLDNSMVGVADQLTLGSAGTLMITVTGFTPVRTGRETEGYSSVTAGSAVLGGALEVLPSFSRVGPELGDEFFVVSTDPTALGGEQITGMFDVVSGTLVGTDLALAPFLEDTDGDLVADALLLRALMPGDVNGDLRVSVSDLSVFALHFNTTPGLYNAVDMINSWELGDFNADGAITVADLSLMALNFGFGLGEGSSSVGLSLEAAASLAGIDLSAVPEPGVLGVVGLGAGALLFGRRRERN